MRFLIFLLVLFLSAQASAQHKTLYDFSATTIEGETFDFSTLKGKKVLVVNTASECALTPQFKKLQALYEEYGGDDFEIIGFPTNDFGSQDPGTNREISTFCEQKYGITFQMMAKISIKGDDIHPLYNWLTSSDENGTLDATVKWNFQKFMIDENGQVVDFALPLTSPTSNKIEDWLKE
jgi:glutathione peroxidase